MGSYWVPSCNLLFTLNAPFHVSSQSSVFPGEHLPTSGGHFCCHRHQVGRDWEAAKHPTMGTVKNHPVPSSSTHPLIAAWSPLVEAPELTKPDHSLW